MSNDDQQPPQYPPYSYDPDMTIEVGNSLGYSQSMEYRSMSVPQPSQAMPQLDPRASRLQQLREERMRRKQGLGSRPLGNNSGVLSSSNAGVPPGARQSPLVLPGQTPIQKQTFPTPDVQASPSAVGANDPYQLSSAAAPAQDTAMIQRVQVQRAAFLITGAFLLSSILGLVRTFLFSYIFGAGIFSTDYLQAYLIPNLLFTVVSGGALSSAFIPVFTKYYEGLQDEKTAWHIASSALNLSVVIMIALSAFAMIFAPQIVPIYSPASQFTPADVALIVTLTRIMLLQAIVLGSGVIVTSVLNAKQDFKLTAIGTVLYNVGQIIGLVPGLFLAYHARGNASAVSSIAVYSATFGVVLAAILQVGVQIPGLFKVKMRYTFAFDWRNPGVRQIGRQMIPRMVNAAMLSFSTAMDRILLSLLGLMFAAQVVNGQITEYFYAFSILVLPVSIFGSSVSTAAFPSLASYVARDRYDRVRSIIMETLRGILFLAIPACIGLIVLALPIIQVLLEHGRFTLPEAQLTVTPLIFFALGLPGLAAVEILTRAFYALRDSRTPVIVSILQFVLKIALSIVLIDSVVFGVQWGMGALAFSTSVASVLEAAALFILLYQRIGGFDLRALVDFIKRCSLAAAAMGVVLFFVHTILDLIIHTTTSYQLTFGGVLLALVKLLIELGVGSLVFLVAAKMLKIEEINSGMVRRILDRLHIFWL
ncbi:MAG TPA: murein biosynthesis integral membrane protein MurJ [Ktedonobacteraceae bacterium]|jgi:putative peptidoglycan lipid II flippase|nr:murein biosynthesis integral membrane protein MurJ [Ktedonobacteraceae bacterium]